jgi:hypothetical protein
MGALTCRTFTSIVKNCHLQNLQDEKFVFSCSGLDFHGGDYEESCAMVCDTVFVLLEPAILRNVSPPSSGRKESLS